MHANEAGSAGFESFIPQGLFAPSGTSPEMIAKINAAVNQVLSTPEMTKRLETLKAEFQPNSAAQYKTWLDGQSTTWAKIIKDSGFQPQ